MNEHYNLTVKHIILCFMGRRKSGISYVIDSFIDSINRTGGSSSIWVASLFLIGGLLSSYMGYSERYLPTMLGGPIAIIIGIAIFYKSAHRQKRKKHI